MDLEGKVAVVTGSSRGIGKAIALALARAGADVVVTARTEVERDLPGTIYQTAAEISALGRKTLAVPTDVTQEEQVQHLAEGVYQEFGRADILVNNAGIMGRTQSFLETDLAYWDAMLAVNLRGAFLCARALVPLMVQQKGGCLINISSGAARGIGYLSIAYGVSKAGLDRLTLGLADELRHQNIAVISLYPGMTRTEGLLHEPSLGDPALAQPPELVGQAVVYLLTHDPMAFSGQIVTVRALVESHNL